GAVLAAHLGGRIGLRVQRLEMTRAAVVEEEDAGANGPSGRGGGDAAGKQAEAQSGQARRPEELPAAQGVRTPQRLLPSPGWRPRPRPCRFLPCDLVHSPSWSEGVNQKVLPS